MKILPHERLEVSVLEDAVKAGIKFKINNATSVVKKAKALVIKPAKAKTITLMEGRNYDNVPHKVRVRIYSRKGKVSFEAIYKLDPGTSLKYNESVGFHVVDSRRSLIKPITHTKGDTGDTGLQGITGKAGIIGDTGKQGLVGQQGIKGDIGEMGMQGLTGNVGEIGLKGDQGEVGPTGLVGPRGPKGLTGKAAVNGTDGESGTSFTWRSEWSLATAYVVNDVVAFEGSSYIATVPSTGKLPTEDTFWDLMALMGEQGEEGEKGERGPRGRTGGGGGGEAVAPVASGTTLVHTLESGDILRLEELEFYPMPRRFMIKAGGSIRLIAGAVLLGRP